ncbi:MAG: prepilin-type N-terminal cleavage/methylation domain-containing protein [bacterium]
MNRPMRRMSESSRSNRFSNDGFSLVELMVAMAFIGIGLMALAQVFIMSAKHTSVGRKDSAATHLSAEILDRMRCLPYDDMVAAFRDVDTNVPSTVPVQSREWSTHLADQLGPGARGRVRIFTDIDDGTLVRGLARVEVTISWADRGDTLNLMTPVLISKVGV